MFIYSLDAKCCYRDGVGHIEMIHCNTNNGVERQNESFKYTYLQRHKNSSITGMLSILTEEFLLDKYEKYLIFCHFLRIIFVT